ncbi:hypothetical protein [Bremerella sp.]|uniref:hypothetical protein n=1 Tax=Bremerella sp. TaxID=2795602 RepID=UPI003919A06D
MSNSFTRKHEAMTFVQQVVSVSVVAVFLIIGATEEARGEGRAELVLTYGESGLPRGNVFHVGEKVFATIRLSGLADPPPYVGQIQVTGSVVDAQGREVLRVDNEPENYWQVLGGDTLEATLVIDSDRKGIPPGSYTLIAMVQHLRTAKRFEVRRDFVWKNAEGFTTDEFRWLLDLGEDYPAGPLLQPGRVYWLFHRNLNTTFVNRSLSIRKQVFLYSPNEEMPIGKTGVFEHSTIIPENRNLPERIWSSIGLEFSRAEDIQVSVDFMDMPSGDCALDRISARVASTIAPRPDEHKTDKPFMVLTHGALGKVRQTAYLGGEDIWLTVGFADPGKGALSQQIVKCFLRDREGELLKEVRLDELFGHSGFSQSFFIELIKIPGSSVIEDLETISEIELQLTQKETGKTTVLTAPIRFSPTEQFSAFNVRLSADSWGEVPAGEFLTAGATYHLQCDITKYAIQDYAMNVTHAVKAFTADGQPIEGTELVLEHAKELSVAEKLESKHPLSMQISLNRPGKFILRWTFTDNLSGETFTTDLPVEVVSPFQFMKTPER